MYRILTWLALLYGCACLFILAIGFYPRERFISNHTPAPESVSEDAQEYVWVWNGDLIDDFYKKNRTPSTKLKGAVSPCVLPIEQVRQLERQEAEAYEKEKREIEALLSGHVGNPQNNVHRHVPRNEEIDWAWGHLSEDFAKKYRTARSKLKCAVPPSVLPIEQVIADPQKYAHKLITIHGCYFKGEEFEAVRSCGDDGGGVTMVGLFDTGGDFGHLGAYQHQLVLVDVLEAKPFTADPAACSSVGRTSVGRTSAR